MAFNMVANRGDSGSKLNIAEFDRQLVKLRLTEDKRRTVNLIEWDELLRALLSTHQLSHFLESYWCIRMPSDKIAETMIQLQVDGIVREKIRQDMQEIQHEKLVDSMRQRQASSSSSSSSSSSARDSYDLRSGRSQSLGGVPEEDDDDVARELHMGQGDGSGLSINTPAMPGSRRALSKTQESAYQSLITRRALDIAKAAQSKTKADERKGIRQVTFYMNPLTWVEGHERDVNPLARYPIEDKEEGITKWYELEGEMMRKQRMTVWQVMLRSVSLLPQGLFKSIPIGNTHALYTRIIENFTDGERGERLEQLIKELRTIVKSPDELFSTFSSKFLTIIDNMRAIDIDLDESMIRKQLDRALSTECRDKTCRDLYTQITAVTAMAIDETSETVTHNHLIRGMQNPMKLLEQTNRREGTGNNRSGGMTRSQRRTLRLSQRGNQGQTQTDSLKGICLAYQDNACKKGNSCSYEHRRISKRDKDKLKETVAKTRARQVKDVVCYNCDQKRHYASSCPKPRKQTRAQVNRTTSSQDNSSDDIATLIRNSTEAEMVSYIQGLRNAMPEGNNQ